MVGLGSALLLDGATVGKDPVAAGSGGNSSGWKCAYTLDSRRRLVSGSEQDLAAAIRRGADLRIYTEFRHNEHIDTGSTDPELIREVADFRVTYLVEDRWTAGIINLRQPISLPDGFGPRPSMSFFLYNQDGRQAIARPHLDGGPITGRPGPSPPADHSTMPKYHELDNWDAGTNAPSSNFIYDFETFRFWVHDEWREVLSHTERGDVVSGSIDTLAEAFTRGQEVKVGIRGLCGDLAAGTRAPGNDVRAHEVFVQVGSCYYYTKRKQFMAASQPVVRVEPAIPMGYRSKNWDFGWLMPRSDGFVARWLVDPYTLKFHKSDGRYAMRWFVR
jgi:hypothetical protein